MAEPLMPILCSIDWVTTSLEPEPSSRSRGTMKRLSPLVPVGASGVRARTRWMMFSARSWSPLEMKTLVPSILYVPPPIAVARVTTAPTSEPACASVRHIVPP